MNLICALPLMALAQNGLVHMAQAVPHVTVDYIVATRLQATETARQLMENQRLVPLALASANPRHRMAAAFMFGMSLDHDPRLIRLISDGKPIVPQAAREALIHIAAQKYGEQVDFGPTPGCGPLEKSHSEALWREYFAGKTGERPHLFSERSGRNDSRMDPVPQQPMAPRMEDLLPKAPDDNQQPEAEDYESPLPTDGFDPAWLIVRLSMLGLGIAGARFAKDLLV